MAKKEREGKNQKRQNRSVPKNDKESEMAKYERNGKVKEIKRQQEISKKAMW